MLDLLVEENQSAEHNKPLRFRDFLKQYGKLSFTQREKEMGFQGFMAALGMFAFLYAFITAPDFPGANYISPHGDVVLSIGLVFSISAIVRWQYLEWQKRGSRKIYLNR